MWKKKAKVIVNLFCMFFHRGRVRNFIVYYQRDLQFIDMAEI